MRDVIFAVADNGSDCKTLDIGCAFLAVAVGDIIDCTFVILLEDIDIKYVLAYKFLVGYRSDDIFPVAEEDNHVVDIRAVGYELVLLQGCSDKSFFAVDVKFFVGFHHFGSFDRVEVTQFGTTREVLAVFVLQHLIPVDGIVDDVRQVVVNFGNILFHPGNEFVRFVRVELQDTSHFDFH